MWKLVATEVQIYGLVWGSIDRGEDRNLAGSYYVGFQHRSVLRMRDQREECMIVREGEGSLQLPEKHRFKSIEGEQATSDSPPAAILQDLNQ